MYHKILLPVDLNEESSWTKALPTAITLCQTFDASLHVVTVLPEFKMPMVGAYFPKDFSKKAHEAVKEAQHTFIQQHVPETINTQSVIVDGSPWEAIIKVGKQLDIDLIVMASHTKRKFVDYVLGPNAEHVVHHAKMSVMIVR
ncbi:MULTISPECIES: universal stress protein [unclassified Halomonas]|uniref:universal stress protein n=1 Tax=unclassified Halomonas TaxID=2609666 RepID=UPI0006D9E683|nr:MULTISPECIES: universal stress protein [unclassified Halomonas]KPQ21322.1 MAG: universal stress protein family protein [Halomonas sp. HL-93]SBR46560.1 Nucleotide-binding universal stress protein, UspA family [Halomonas sp. HL-93]SNY98807.1 Nucleotide-binding universal stress protein, UspA family [Halomonas sp. hl-4]